MFVHLAILLLFSAITVYANRTSNPAHSCYNDGDTETCISYIQICWKLSSQQLEKDRDQMRQLSGKIRHDPQVIQVPVYNVALFCFAIGQVPVDGDCDPCTKNCAFKLNKDVCDFFCKRPINFCNFQSTSAIQTTPTSTSDRLEVVRGAFNTTNATLSNRTTNITRVDDTTASSENSYLKWACLFTGIIAVIIFIMVVGVCVFYQLRHQMPTRAHLNGGVSFMGFICLRFLLYFLRFCFRAQILKWDQ